MGTLEEQKSQRDGSRQEEITKRTASENKEADAIHCWRHGCYPDGIQLSRGEPTQLCQFCQVAGSFELVVRLAKPFKRAVQVRCDLVLVTAKGSFQDGTFSNSSGMHIGICDNQGRVLEFYRAGLRFNDDSRLADIWQECVPLRFIERLLLSISRGDDKLGITMETIWCQAVEATRVAGAKQYDRDSYNCLDFVLDFLKNRFLARFRVKAHPSQQVSIDQIIERRLCDKLTFCQQFVVQQTSQVAKYILLDRKLRSGSTWIGDESSSKLPESLRTESEP